MWDYKIVTVCPGIIPREDLQDLGWAGWELVAIISNGNDTDYYFKRPTAPTPN